MKISRIVSISVHELFKNNSRTANNEFWWTVQLFKLDGQEYDWNF